MTKNCLIVDMTHNIQITVFFCLYLLNLTRFMYAVTKKNWGNREQKYLQLLNIRSNKLAC